MKVLHVITSLRTGGAEKLLSELLPLLKIKGINVELALFDGTHSHIMDTIKRFGIKVHILGMGKLSMYNPLHIIRLRRLFKNFDIIHSHNTSAQLFTAIAARKTNRIITTEHNTDNRRRKYKALYYLDTWMYRKYNLIACCSNSVKHSLTSYLKFNNQRKFVTVENGIELQQSKINPIAERHLDIVMVASFRPQKDHITPLKALQLLPHNINLVFAGDGETRYEVEKKVKEMALENRVTFLGAIADVAGLFSQAKVALLSTHYEGFGLVCIEAMASGTPLIATDVDGTREVCNESAILYPDKDYNALADILRCVLDSTEKQMEMSSKGLKHVSKYDINHTATKYLTLYSNLIS